jgi:hypothetical protein
MAFANLGDLQVYLGREITEPLEVAQADYLLDLATVAIQDEIGQTVQAGTATVNLAGVWGPDLELPQRPVAAVTQVKLDGTVLAAGSWRWPTGSSYITRRAALPNAGQDWDWDEEWSLPQGAVSDITLGWGGWGGPGAIVTVSYDFGASAVPKGLRSLCLQVAARSIASPVGGVTQESLGGYSVTYAGSIGATLTDDERRSVRRRYGRTAGTVTPRGL